MNNTSSVMNNTSSVMKMERKYFVLIWPRIGRGKKFINPLLEKAHKANTVSRGTCCIGCGAWEDFASAASDRQSGQLLVSVCLLRYHSRYFVFSVEIGAIWYKKECDMYQVLDNVC
jgi:hypothetical protein